MADEDFDVVGNGSVKQDKTADGFWMGSNLSNLSVAEYETIKTKYKVIAKAGSILRTLSLATIQQALAQASSQSWGIPRLHVLSPTKSLYG